MNLDLGRILIVPALAACLVRPAPAQVKTVALGYQHDAFGSADPVWTDWQRLSIQFAQQTTDGAIGFEASISERFAENDPAFAADLYRSVWPRAYGNLRIGVAPGAQTLPRADAYGELFQFVGGGVELSASYRYMHLPAADVHVFGTGAGYFSGKAYMRLRVSAARQSNVTATLASLTTRYGTRDDFIEGAAGAGREIVIVGAGPATDLYSTSYGMLRGQYFWNQRIGAAVMLGYTRLGRIPDRTTLGGQLLVRW